MALVIEDGSIVSGAQSYATAVQLGAYAAARGLTVSAVEADREKLLIKAMDYLATLESRYKGQRVSDEQPLSWPREGVYLYGSDNEFANDEIPQALIDAQCRLAYDSIATDLLPTTSGREIRRRKVDVIETEYAPGSSNRPELIAAMGILEVLFKTGMAVKVIRA